MTKFWIHVFSGAAALLCAGGAHSAVIDFENVDASGAPFAPLLSDGDYLLQGDYFVQTLDANNASNPFVSDGSLVGQLSTGSAPGSCLDGTCPAGNSSTFLSVLNNGLVYIAGTGSLVLSSFDAAFLPPSGVALPAGSVALLGIEADRSDGSYAIGVFNLNGPSAVTGATSFASYRASDAQIVAGTGTLTSGEVIDLYAYAYYCGTSASCSFESTNRGQFAIDNIALNVPEPSEWALMALGLGALGIAVRRRRSL